MEAPPPRRKGIEALQKINQSALDLNADVSKLDLEEIQCYHCGAEVTGKSISCQGQRWHPHCFVCSGCQRDLGGGTFKSSGGSIWCRECYLEFRAPRCVACSKPTEGQHMIVLSMPMHVECFKCEMCHKELRSFRPAETSSGKVLITCEDCFEKVEDKKDVPNGVCSACNNPIDEGVVPFLWEERQWHQTCFCCVVCGDALGPNNIPVKRDDQPYCQPCCKQQPADAPEDRCHSCRQVIKDMVIHVHGSNFHRHCVCCEYCQERLVKEGEEKSVRIDEYGKPSCDRCYARKHRRSVGDAQRPWLSSASRQGQGFLQIRIRKALNLFKDEPVAREAYIVFKVGLQVLYSGKRTVSKAVQDTVWDEVWEFRKIDVSETIFELQLSWKQQCMGRESLYLKDLVAGISAKEFRLPHGILIVEFTWRPQSVAKRAEAFQKYWEEKSAA